MLDVVLSFRRINVRDVLLCQQADCGSIKRRWILRGWWWWWRRRWKPRYDRSTGLPMSRGTKGTATIAEKDSTIGEPILEDSYAFDENQYNRLRTHHLRRHLYYRTRPRRASKAESLSSSSNQAQGTNYSYLSFPPRSHHCYSMIRSFFFF